MAQKKRFKIKVTFNAPVTLSFVFACALVVLVDWLLKKNTLCSFLSSGGGRGSASPFEAVSFLSYIKLFFHIFGHVDFSHFVSNVAFVLLLGPMLEEKYGSVVLALMMAVTALVSGVVNACFGRAALMGAGDIAFMMVLLSAFTSLSKKEIPLSFILIVVLYIGREVFGVVTGGNASLSNIAGGVCGSLFAFLAVPKSSRKSSSGTSKSASTKKTKAASSQDETTQYDSNSYGYGSGSYDNSGYSDGYSGNYGSSSGSGNSSDSDDASTVIGSIDL